VAHGSTEQEGPGWWLASDGRWYPPTEEVERKVEALKDIALVTGVLFFVTLVTYLFLSR
jgi:hypothetical protein